MVRQAAVVRGIQIIQRIHKLFATKMLYNAVLYITYTHTFTNRPWISVEAVRVVLPSILED